MKFLRLRNYAPTATRPSCQPKPKSAIATYLAGPELQEAAKLAKTDPSVSPELAETIAKSALYRAESRGAHYREDHPESDDERWLRHTVAVLEDGEVDISTAPVMVTRPISKNRYTSHRL